MSMNATQHREALAAHMPPGQAFTRRNDSNLMKLLHGIADSLETFTDDADGAINERIPDTISDGYGLDEWENALALPEHCVLDAGVTLTETERRGAVQDKLSRSGGGLSAQYYIDMAAAYGETITIETDEAAAVCGDAICGEAVCGEIETEFVAVVRGTISSTAMESVLECLINDRKPAHIAVIYDWT